MKRLRRVWDFYRYFRLAEYPNSRRSSLRMALPYFRKRWWRWNG